MIMKTKSLTVAELKAQFSSVVADLRAGEEIVITYGRNKTPLATLVPSPKAAPDYSIEIGDLEKAGWTYEMHNFEMTDEEFLNS